MFLGADEQSTKRHGWTGVTEFAKRKAVQDFEVLAGFQDDEFAGGGDCEQTAIDPNGRAEVVAADSFLVTDAAGRGIDHGEYARVAEKPRAIADGNTRRNIGGRLLYLVGEFRNIRIRRRRRRLDGGDEISAATRTTRTIDNISGKNR